MLEQLPVKFVSQCRLTGVLQDVKVEFYQMGCIRSPSNLMGSWLYLLLLAQSLSVVC